MNVLVTGGLGYLGSWVVPKLLARGHRVRVLDKDFFSTGSNDPMLSKIELIREDVREVCHSRSFLQRLVEDCDGIIHLAALSNDPSADLNPAVTWEINYKPTVTLARRARDLGIPFVFSSTCAVYGAGAEDRLLTEESSCNPLTVYAETKYEAENALRALATRSWSPRILRNGTLFGYSRRMRFDLVVNLFALDAQTRRRVTVFGTGEQYRPHLHVRDAAAAMVYFLLEPSWDRTVVNVGHENLTVRELTEILQGLDPAVEVVDRAATDEDRRNYRVDTTELRRSGFVPEYTVRMGLAEIAEAVAGGTIPDPESICYRNVKWLRRLMEDACSLMGTAPTAPAGNLVAH